MDKLYKAHFLSQLKARMPLDQPEFAPHRLPKDHPLRRQFTGSLLYLKTLPTQHCVWLEWFPGEGVEREFYAMLGWSPSPLVLPRFDTTDQRIHFLHEPDAEFASGTLNVQQVERRPAVRGFEIATPWDQLYRLSPRVSDAERKTVMDKAFAEYLALSDAQRIDAVRVAMNEAFRSIAAVLPAFSQALVRVPRAEG
jgi:hypothetical protein